MSSIERFFQDVKSEYDQRKNERDQDLQQQAREHPYTPKRGRVSYEEALENLRLSERIWGWTDFVGIAARKGLQAAAKNGLRVAAETLTSKDKGKK